MQIRETSAEPRYLQLANTLRSSILSGRYARGTKLPSESELQSDTGFSRSTVRKALGLLEHEGIITKERGRGTFVSETLNPRYDELLFSSFTALMEQQGRSVSTKVVDAMLAVAPNDVAEFLHVANEEQIVRITRLRCMDGTPFCIETSYLPPRFAALVDQELEPSLYQTLRNRFHEVPGCGRKAFEICFATTEEASLLDAECGTALMLITDTVYDDAGAPLHVSKRVIHTERAKYVEPI